MRLVLLLLLPMFSLAQRQSGTIPYDPILAHHEGAAKTNGFRFLFDNSTGSFSVFGEFGTNWVYTDSSTFTFPFLPGSNVKLGKIRFFDFTGSENSVPNYSQVWIVKPNNDSVYVGVWRGALYNQWQEYNVDSIEAKAVLLKVYRGAGNVVMPTEIQFVGSYTNVTPPEIIYPETKLGMHLGANMYPYTLQLSSSVNSGLDPIRTKVFNDVCAAARVYYDWNWAEAFDPDTLGGYSYTFQYSGRGGWNLDSILYSLKQNNVYTLLAIKDAPDYIKKTYPAQRTDLIPIVYDAPNHRKNKSNPASYLRLAKLVTEAAGRFGHNTDWDTSLGRQYRRSLTPWNPPIGQNVNKAGLGILDIIEIGNENDKDWAGPNSFQSNFEKVAEMSICYDGHMGMFPNVGIKVADPTMLVALGGFVGANSARYAGLVYAASVIRGYNPDSSVNVPWDIAKFHTYVSDAGAEQFTGTRTRGAAPETQDIEALFTRMMRATQPFYKGGGKAIPVHIGEFGYDVNNTQQQALDIPGKGKLNTQADWLARYLFWNFAFGLQSSQMYQFADDGNARWIDEPNGVIDMVTPSLQYTGGGMVTRSDSPRKRPSARVYEQLKRDWKHLKRGGWHSRPVRFGLTKQGVAGYNGDTAFVYRTYDSLKARSVYGFAYGTEINQTGNISFDTDSSAVVLWRYAYDTTISSVDTIQAVAGKASIPVSEALSFFWEINTESEFNNPPTVDAPAGGMVVNAPYVVPNINAVDIEDGTDLLYSWSQIGGPTATIINATAKNPTITDLKAGVYAFRVVVTDQAGAFASATFSFNSRIRISGIKFTKDKPVKVKSKL